MVAKVLAVVGVLAVAAVGAAGVGGLLLVKDRVRVVVQPDVVADDALALVRDDLDALRGDVRAIADALGDNLGRLADGLDAAATRRQQEQLARCDSLQRGLDALHARLQQLEQRRDIGAAPTAGGAPGEPDAVAAEPTPAAAPGREPGPAAEPGPPAEPVAAPAPPSRSFLSFQLPARTLAFDQPHDFEVIGELSRVGFDAKSTLHDFSGATQRVRGTLHCNLADPSGAWSGSVECDAATLVTGVDGRDTAMREHLDTAHHPALRFEIRSFAPAPDGIDAAAQTVRGTVRGAMQIRGVERDLEVPVRLHVDDSRRLCIEGSAPLSLPDYQVPVPSQLGLINMQPTVQIWLALRARVRSGGDGRGK